MVSRRERVHVSVRDVENAIRMARQRVNRTLGSIHRSLRTIQRTRDRIPPGRAAALRVEDRYQQRLQDVLARLSPQRLRQMALNERIAAATAVSAELVELGAQLMEASKSRLLSAEGDHRIDARGAARGQIAGRERDEREQSGGAAERDRIEGAHAEEETP